VPAWSKPSTIAVAINPESCFGTKREVGSQVAARLRDAGYHVGELVAGDAAALRIDVQRAIAEGAEAVVVVGGDGMVSLGANIVAGTGIPLGLVPSGTGNDAARGLGIPIADTAAAVARLLTALERAPSSIDAGRIAVREDPTAHGSASPVWFFGALSAGFDAVVNERANAMGWPRGPRRYTIAILRELLTLRPKRYRVVADGVSSTIDALLLSVANNGSIGGGMKIVPDADLSDGELDLFVVTPMSRLAFLRLFPKVFTGAHVGLPVVRIERVTSVELACESAVVAYADGERVGELPLRIDVVPGALKVLI
jgi:diacylglycerol kinase (ATP)